MSPQLASTSAGRIFHVKMLHNFNIRRCTKQPFRPDVNQRAAVLSCRPINRLIPRVLERQPNGICKSTDIGSCRTEKQRKAARPAQYANQNPRIVLTLANKILQSWKLRSDKQQEKCEPFPLKLCASTKLEAAVVAELKDLQALDKFPRTFRGLKHYYRGKKFP